MNSNKLCDLLRFEQNAIEKDVDFFQSLAKW